MNDSQIKSAVQPLPGWSECSPFILVARRRPGLPLASLPSRRAWLVELVQVAGAASQRGRDGGSERVLPLRLSNRHAGQCKDGCLGEERELC